MFELNLDDPRPIYRQIADEVQRTIMVGILKPDDTLPAIRQLAAMLKVNPNTIQHAYRQLEREGAVYVRRGRGTFVARGAVIPSGHDRRRQSILARQVAERALRDAFRHGLVASELVEAIRDIAPKIGT
ncbi:MAG: GntR family transcriptional regulator [Vicinamibacterales bacterium]